MDNSNDKDSNEAQDQPSLLGDVSGSSLPRIYIKEHQEFIIEGQIFIWLYSNPELKQGLTIYRKGAIEPSKFTVSVVKNYR